MKRRRPDRAAPAVDAHHVNSLEYRTCPACGKRGYPDRATAKAALRWYGEPMRVYKCWSRPDDDPGLYRFHLGHVRGDSL